MRKARETALGGAHHYHQFCPAAWEVGPDPELACSQLAVGYPLPFGGKAKKGGQLTFLSLLELGPGELRVGKEKKKKSWQGPLRWGMNDTLKRGPAPLGAMRAASPRAVCTELARVSWASSGYRAPTVAFLCQHWGEML